MNEQNQLQGNFFYADRYIPSADCAPCFLLLCTQERLVPSAMEELRLTLNLWEKYSSPLTWHSALVLRRSPETQKSRAGSAGKDVLKIGHPKVLFLAIKRPAFVCPVTTGLYK